MQVQRKIVYYYMFYVYEINYSYTDLFILFEFTEILSFKNNADIGENNEF